MRSARFSRRTEAEQFERIKTRVFDSSSAACKRAADEIEDLIRRREKEGRPAVLGLATGSTPVPLYRELIRRHREEGLSFANVRTFNLDEYFGLEPEHRESYARFMREQLFDHIDIAPEHARVPSGLTPRDEVFGACGAYEDAIAAVGGIDIQILGIGRSGHIGFNEPGSSRDSQTRLVTLDRITRQDAARDFLGVENVPRFAITMGVGTILEARRVLLMAWGGAKAGVVAKAVEGNPTEAITASFLQHHPDAEFLVDRAAAEELTRYRHPWLVGPIEWTAAQTRRAVTWLARRIDKPILKLLDEDYSENGLADLVTREGRAYDINIRIFNEIQHTITGWPGGKPNADDSHRPERAAPHPKRVVVLSPEPMDDVFGMGGTLSRLVRQGHDVRVMTLTSGNLGVPDAEARKVARLLDDAGAGDPAILAELDGKAPHEADSPALRRLKGSIRKNEARMSAEVCGVPDAALMFLDLPFYEQGRYRQFKPSEADVTKLREALAAARPHQIFATGRGADPSSLEALGFSLLREALAGLQGESWLDDLRIWIYRVAGEDWEAHQIEMAVPLSPDELAVKIKAIYQHGSQRSQTPQSDGRLREAWQLAEVRNQSTARTYDQLGLANYEAIESFRRESV